MDKKLELYQIYYNEESKKNCYQFTNHYFNEKCTVLFENQVIRTLIEQKKHLESEYFGVFSHAFKLKMLQYRNATSETFENMCNGADVVSFFGKFQQKSIFAQAESYHKGFGAAFRLMLKRAIDIDFKGANHTIYIMQNHFIAKSEVYWDYVESLLIPCINALNDTTQTELQDLIWNPKQRYTYERQRFKQNPDLINQLGVNYYPMHAFLLERLPSLYFTINKHKKQWKLMNF